MFDHFIYTDGACYPTNGGDGGWAAVILDSSGFKITAVLWGNKKRTTNNQMELQAIISAVHFFLPQSKKLTIYSDSAYAVNSIGNWLDGKPFPPKGWMARWKRNNWVGSSGKIKNVKYFEKLETLVAQHELVFLEHVQGHSGKIGNEIADQLAVAAKQGLQDSTKVVDFAVVRGAGIQTLFGTNLITDIEYVEKRAKKRKRRRK